MSEDRARVPTHAPEGVKELLRRWHRGDTDALNALLERNMPHLQAYARSQLGGRLRWKEETGDVIQDAVVNFMKYGPPFLMESEEHFRNLMKKVVDHVLLGHHEFFSRLRRDVCREHPLPEGTTVVMEPFVDSADSPSQIASEHEHEAMVRLALETMDPIDHKVVTLRIYKNLPFAEIGEQVDMSDNAARVRFNRAVAKVSKKVLLLKQGKLDSFFSD